MVHRWNVNLSGLFFLVFHIKVLRVWLSLGDFFQRIDIFVIHAAEELPVKGLDDHGFGSFFIMNLTAVGIQQTVIVFLKLDAVSAVYSPFC